MHKLKDFFIHNTYNASLGNTSSSLAQQILGLSANQVQQRSSVKKQLNQSSNAGNENYQFSPLRKKWLL